MEEFMVDDEELTDPVYSSAKPPLYVELIEKYCNHLEEKIKSANSYQEANQIVTDICRGFEKECISEMLPLFLQKNVTEILKKYWPKQK